MSRKALIIDDDSTTLELLTFQLSSEGYDVTTANSGTEGLSKIESNDFDIILTDLNMPDINGIELVRRSREIVPETEIIVVTGDDSTEMAVEATRVGAFDYIVKPVDFEKLFVGIKNAVESKEQARVNALQARGDRRTPEQTAEPNLIRRRYRRFALDAEHLRDDRECRRI